jgi:[acyl-carrier-protein] S-malonyltransferase
MIKGKSCSRKSEAAIIFPGCGIRYLGNELEILKSLGYEITDFFNRAEAVSTFDRTVFLKVTDGDFTDELQGQFATYIYSCAISDMLKKQGLQSSYSAGYSMGLYAALYHTGAVSFENGIQLIEYAYKCIKKSVYGSFFSAAVIMGLTINVIETLIEKYSNEVEVINVNNEISIVISGTKIGVKSVMDASLKEGALKAIQLPMSIPYHSSFARAASEEFRLFLSDIEITCPESQLISCTDQKLLKTPEQMRNALEKNMSHSINWKRTIEDLLKKGTKLFIECGPGESLSKICKFIDGNYSIVKGLEVLVLDS